MSPVFAAARARPARVVYAEGEDERVLRAVQAAIDEGLVSRAIAIGRPAVIETRCKRAGLRIRPGADFDVTDPEDDARFRDYWSDYRLLMGRRGVTPELAKATIRRSATTIAAMMIRRGDADAMVCGLVGRFDDHLGRVRDVIGLARGSSCFATMNALMLPEHTLFLTDTLVNDEPDAEQLAEIARMAVASMRSFAVTPKVAFVSHSMFGASDRPSARRMRAAAALFQAQLPDVECDGEMHGDAALSEEIRREFLPESSLTGRANLLVMPNLDAANILLNVLKVTGGKGITVGPVLLGAARPVHVLTPAATMRRVLNATAIAVAQASREAGAA
jgi:malate dehydrogenase (oxaloacetate-decarboxylating)(NADP+)